MAPQVSFNRHVWMLLSVILDASSYLQPIQLLSQARINISEVTGNSLYLSPDMDLHTKYY